MAKGDRVLDHLRQHDHICRLTRPDHLPCDFCAGSHTRSDSDRCRQAVWVSTTSGGGTGVSIPSSGFVKWSECQLAYLQDIYLSRPVVSVLAQKFGKRPQFLFAAVSGTLGTAICIIGSHQSHYDTLLAGRLVQGLGMTAWESLSLAAMGEMFYLHERGWRTAVCFSAFLLLPLIMLCVGSCGLTLSNR